MMSVQEILHVPSCFIWSTCLAVQQYVGKLQEITDYSPYHGSLEYYRDALGKLSTLYTGEIYLLWWICEFRGVHFTKLVDSHGGSSRAVAMQCS